MAKAKLISTDSYFNIFPILNGELDGKTQGLYGHNLIFCEEKLTLMTERSICGRFGGSFNTEVYSFGNFLRAKKPIKGLLSKEGSAMCVKKVLKDLRLKRFSRAKADVAFTLFEVISQLKAAGVTPEELFNASNAASGILSDKLFDIASVYSAYEQFTLSKGLTDTNTALSFLPEIIENDPTLNDADVYIIGYVGFTGQMRNIISALLKRAKSVTAILTGGKNTFAFVNETVGAFKNLCLKNKVPCEEKFIKSNYSAQGEIIKDGTFDPLYRVKEKAGDAFYLCARNEFDEIERIAEVVANSVRERGARYKDITLIIPENDDYKQAIKRSFKRLSIPFFLDAKRKPENFPIISLVYAYTEVFLKGFTAASVCAFVKNPYFSEDREFTDDFENYILQYGINYDKFKKPFFLGENDIDKDKFAKFEELRARTVGFFDKFDVFGMLERLDAQSKTADFAEKLRAAGETEDAAVLSQTYDKVKNVLNEMRYILAEEDPPIAEFKAVFKSGVSAMEVSVIPQYNDAVFVGNFKQAALAQAKYLFVAGLTDGVPETKEDVALLSDEEIDILKGIKVLVEPKILVVNKRKREETVLGASAFTDELYLSYPVSDLAGDKNQKSEMLAFFGKFFRFKDFPPYNGYLTEKQGRRTFARECFKFASLKCADFIVPSSFYNASEDKPDGLILSANSEPKIKLDGEKGVLTERIDSPTAIEAFYKCPLNAFLSRALNARKRHTGDMDNMSVGTFMHDILAVFMKKASACDYKENAEKLFMATTDEVLKKERYAFYDEGASGFNREIALKECKKYCLKLYEFGAKSKFKTKSQDLEAGFGDEAGKSVYGPILLADGKVRIKGKIDRIDTCNDDIRILDYKTTVKEFDNTKFYTGREIQLFLYSLLFPEKRLAGAYYVSVSDEYKSKRADCIASGKTVEGDCLSESERGFISDKEGRVSESEMKALRAYAKAVSENAVKNLNDGVIAASPFENGCENCEYADICKRPFAERTSGSVSVKYIAQAMENQEKGDAENGENA